MKSLKNTALTVVYLIILSIILLLNNIAFSWITGKIVGPLFEWFLNIHWIWKIIVVIFGGGALITLFYNILTAIGGIINIFFSRMFPCNLVTQFGSVILCLINIVFMEIQFWPLLQFDFWIFILWLIIAGAIFQINWIFIYSENEN